MSSEYKFNFTKRAKNGYTSVRYDEKTGAPLYEESAGFGFVNETSILPAREVHTAQITSDGTGFFISEPQFFAEENAEKDNCNQYGMVFRMDAPAGAYEIVVRTASDLDDTIVSVSGMKGDRLLEGGFWDAAKLISVKHPAAVSGKEWSYSYVNGRSFIDIEIEPRRIDTPVGVEEIVVKPIALQVPSEDTIPTIFLLGDSTVKSYTFEEAPMSGWGQVIHPMFDPGKINVINYSMGGRSFRNAYAEGRLNDILMTGKAGDYIFIQFGHNDEREDEHQRYGRGATEAMYATYIEDVYLPAIRARGMLPLLVTPMSRADGSAKPEHWYTNSFKKRKFPDIMKKLGSRLGVSVIDLNTRSLEHYNEIGVEAVTAIYMSIEAGETPGKTNDGSCANGHPSQKIDGTHYKEALSKQFARLIVTDLASQGDQGDPIAAEIASYLREDVKEALHRNEWSGIFPEMARDTTVGEGSYYRNQIEKMLQLGVMSKDTEGYFHPDAMITSGEFISALSKLIGLEASIFHRYPDDALTRETMGAILDDAYHARFSSKPKFMTDYNGQTLVPGDPGYDPNPDSGLKGIMYYPIVSYGQLTDLHDLHPDTACKVRDAYELGLIRSEKGIVRGRVMNGTELEPNKAITRAKAAKALYYMWVLAQPVHVENHSLSLP